MGRLAVAPTKQVAFDLLTRAAARKLDAPWVCLSVLGEDGRLRAGSHGLPIASALLISWPFAKQVIASARPWVVADGARDPVASRTAAVRDGTVASYIGLPIIDSSGQAVGTLSVMDRKPRRWSAAQFEFLRSLSAGLVRDLPAREGMDDVYAPSLP
jgi:GAF domain-containing protein